MIHKKRLNGI